MDSLLVFAFLLESYLMSLQLLEQWLRPALPLPPGPRGYPLIGNLLTMPSVTPWKTFREWQNLHGTFLLFCFLSLCLVDRSHLKHLGDVMSF